MSRSARRSRPTGTASSPPSAAARSSSPAARRSSARTSRSTIPSSMRATAAAPSSDVVSPNGDGVDDTETFSYKLVAPSQVTATLAGPGGAQLTLAQDAEEPGVHTLAWNGQPSNEGQWKFVVSGTETGGRTTTAERDVLLDQTLGGLQAEPANAHIAPKATAVGTASFQLVHPATVTATIETRTGIA